MVMQGGMGALIMRTEGMGSPEQTCQLLQLAQQESANSSTFSPCASSVTVELLGPFAWDRCQAGEVALTMLPDGQKSWQRKKRPCSNNMIQTINENKV